jgi:hypothetical protein
LDDALKRFEEGIKLAKRCEKALTDAEKKIEILTKTADGKLEAQPFAGDEDDGGPDAGTPRKASGREPDAEDKDLLF